jgi:RHS repeat-associated protein
VASQVVSTGEWRYHHYDGQGNCILLTDTGGNIREQYDYDAFGMPYVYSAGGATLAAAAQWGNRFLFTGREWLSDLRIYDYRARQYQPELGRFLQPDPQEFAAGDYNLYRYCHNDPVNRSDPTGLVSLTSLGGGDWDWFNGRVALDQLAQQAQTLARSDSRDVPGGAGGKKTEEFPSGFHAAMSLKNAAGDAATKSNESPEAWGPYGEDPKTGKWGTGTIHQGNGVDPKFKDSHTEGVEERVQKSTTGRGDLPPKYVYKGFVLAHKYYNEKFVNRDIARATEKQKSILVVLPPKPYSPHTKEYIWRYHEYGSDTILSNANQ